MLKKRSFINVHASSDELSYIDGRLKNMPLLSGKSEVQELVNMMTLDSLFQAEPELLKNVDLIKIDTEGFEFNVLKGSSNYIKQVLPKFIQLEINWHQLFVNSPLYIFSELLVDYDSFKLLPAGDGLYRINPADPISNIFQLSNVMFIRKDISLEILGKQHS